MAVRRVFSQYNCLEIFQGVLVSNTFISFQLVRAKFSKYNIVHQAGGIKGCVLVPPSIQSQSLPPSSYHSVGTFPYDYHVSLHIMLCVNYIVKSVRGKCQHRRALSTKSCDLILTTTTALLLRCSKDG